MTTLRTNIWQVTCLVLGVALLYSNGGDIWNRFINDPVARELILNTVLSVIIVSVIGYAFIVIRMDAQTRPNHKP